MPNVAPVAAAGRRVPFIDFAQQFAEERAEILAAVERVFAHGDFVNGAAVGALEADLARSCGVRFAVAVNSGTDALIFGLTALGIGAGDEVITPANSFIASTAAIVHVGATPVFADVLPDQTIDPDAIAAAITPRTKAIMPVHLTGRMAEMTTIAALARRHGLAIIEDAAQSFGSRHAGRPSGSFGDVAAFSAHPLKNLNAAGDAGFITTDDPAIAERVLRLRNHGLVDRDTSLEFGFASRLDTIQAAVLRVRLARLPGVLARRQRHAEHYRRLLDPGTVTIADDRPGDLNTFHLFVIQIERRDAVQAALAAHGIATKVHYPIPIHLQPAAVRFGYRRGSLPRTEEQAQRILSLPVHQSLDDGEIAFVAEHVNRFTRRGEP